MCQGIVFLFALLISLRFPSFANITRVYLALAAFGVNGFVLVLYLLGGRGGG